MATYTQDVVVLDAGLLKVPAAADTISLAKVAFTATANFTGCVVTGLAGGTAITDATGTFGYLGAAGALSVTGTTTMDLDCSGAFQINSSGAAISLANDAVNQAVNIATGGTRTLTIGTTTTTWAGVSAGMTLDATTLSIDSVDTTNLTMTANDAGTKTMTIACTNAGAGTASMVLSSDGPWTADAVGVLELNSSAGGISIGNDAVNQNIGIAMGGTRTLMLGTTTTTWNAVAAGMTLDATTLSIDSVDTTNLTMTANDAGTKNMTISCTNAGAGVANLIITADGPMDLDAVGVASINSSGAAINVGNDAANFAINIATGGTRTLTVGTTTTTWVAVAAGMTLDATTLSIDSVDTTNFSMTANDAGSKVMTIAAANSGAGVAQLLVTADGPLDLDAVGILSLNSSGAAINVGNDANNFAINVGTGGTRTVTIGSATATLTLDSTAGAMNITVPDNSAAAWLVQGAADVPRLALATTNSTESLNVNANVTVTKTDGTGAFAIETVAGEALAIGDVITVSGTAGKYFKSDADSATAVRQNVTGIAMITSSADGQLARVAVSGVATVTFTGAIANTDIGKFAYLSATGGQATLTAPTASGSTVYKIGIVASGTGATSASVIVQPQYIATNP